MTKRAPYEGGPPRLARALLRRYSSARRFEEAEGDLEEVFNYRCQQHGRRWAQCIYWKEVMLFCLWQIWTRDLGYEQARGPIMFKSYMTVALRNLRKFKGYAFINISGLAIGIASCLLIMLYVQDELRFDQMHTKADRIYRVVESRTSPDLGEQHFSYTLGPLAPTLVDEFPEVTSAVRMASRWIAGRRTLQRDDTRFYEGDYLFAEPSFFDVFDYPLMKGNPETALNEPLTVVLTESSAHRYFGEENPIGQTLHFESYGDVTVTGVMQDPPHNAHLDFSMLFSWATLDAIEMWNEFMGDWASRGFLTYVVLGEGKSPDVVEAKLADLLATHWDDETRAARTPYLQPLTDIHFGSSHIEFDRNEAKADRTYLYIFSAIAIFIALIACINYMNMATARSMRRAKEVGLRKVVGARRTQVVWQFLGESMLITGIALVLALGFVWAILPAFNDLAGKTIPFSLAENGMFVLGLVAMALIVGVVSGSYPAFYLSKFRPSQVLSGSGDASRGAARLRQGLVVTQFALSIIMMVATLVVYQQLDYVQTKKLGFNQDQLVVVDINSGDVRRSFEAIKQAFAQVPSVHAVSVSSRVPGEWKGIRQVEVVPPGAPDTDVTTMHFIGVDEDFLNTFEVALASGRNFSSDFGADSTSVLLNETAARMLGVTAEGTDQIRVPDQDNFQVRVVGIVEDFHFRSLHEEIGPIVLGYRSNPIQAIDYFTARISGDNIPGTVAQLQAIMERFDSIRPFEYNFLDERLNDFYETEQRVGTLFGLAASLAMLIACLGLFGLAAFMAEQRTKEIGVRKVLGASVSGIIGMLSLDFLKLVGIAFILAVPVAYMMMNQWLADFAYHIDISWGLFAIAGLLTLVISLLTVGYQSIRAALANPARSIRYE